MDKISIELAESRVCDIAEYKTYYELTNRICWYDEPNLNGVELPYDDNAEATAQTLVDMPIVAKYVVDENGEPNLGGHEAKRDGNGDIVFNTVPVGTHTGVEIKKEEVELPSGEKKKLPVLYATQKVWKRYKNYCEAILRLFNAGKLHSSWEISSSEYTFKDGIKILTNYVFEGNAFLGDNVPPAYGNTAKVTALSTEGEIMAASAIAKDVIEQAEMPEENKVEAPVAETAPAEETESVAETEPVAEEEVVEEIAEPTENAEPQPTEEPTPDEGETPPLTGDEIYEALWAWVRESRTDDNWVYLAYWFPADNLFWTHNVDTEAEFEFTEHGYTVDGRVITVGEGRPITLKVSPRGFNAEIERLESEKNDLAAQIVEDNTALSEKDNHIAELEMVKQKYDEIVAEREKNERDEKIAELRDFAKSSGVVTEDEIREGDIASMINALNEKDIKALIADRLVEKIARKPKSEKHISTSVRTEIVSDAPVKDNGAAEFRKYLHN